MAHAKSFHISSNAVTLVFAGAAQLRSYFLDNSANAAPSFYQFFDAAAAASVTLGVTAPAIVIPIPANSAANLEGVDGWNFVSGICVAVTTTYNGSTAPASPVDCTIGI